MRSNNSRLNTPKSLEMRVAGGQSRHRKVLTIDADLCTGCRSCELACSTFHYKQSNPTRSMIKVIFDFKRNVAIPIMCEQCEDPVCKKVCPTRAIVKNANTNAFVVDEDRCIGCILCIIACRLGGLSIDPLTGKTKMCDLCEGDPQCVKVCSVKALNFIEDFRVGTEMKRIKLRKLVETQIEEARLTNRQKNPTFRHIHEEVC